MPWGVEDAQAAVGAGLDVSSPIHAAVIPLLSPASTSGPHFPLSIYGEVELGTQPNLEQRFYGMEWALGLPHPGVKRLTVGLGLRELEATSPISEDLGLSPRCWFSEFEWLGVGAGSSGQGPTWA